MRTPPTMKAVPKMRRLTRAMAAAKEPDLRTQAPKKVSTLAEDIAVCGFLSFVPLSRTLQCLYVGK